MAGVAIDSILDMRTLFAGIPLDAMSVSMTMNGAVLPVMALYVVAAGNRASGPKNWPALFRTTFSKNSWSATPIYTRRNLQCALFPTFSLTSQHMPKFNSISISGYHMQEAGATADLNCLHTGRWCRICPHRHGSRTGYRHIRAAPFFFWAIGMDFSWRLENARGAPVMGAVNAGPWCRKRQVARIADIARPPAGV